MDRIMAQIDGYLGWVKVGITQIRSSFDAGMARDNKGLMDAVHIVLALVMIIVVGVIGIYIADKTLVAIGTPTDANLTLMKNSLIQSGVTGSSFIIILVIAFIGGIAISYMFGMLGRTKGVK